MKKLLAAAAAASVAALSGIALATPAHAYPDDPPAGTPTVAGESALPGAAGAGAAGSALPETGGPSEVLLIGGVALVAAGGVAVAGARRRQSR